MTNHEYQKIITQLRIEFLNDEASYEKAIKPYLEMFQKTHGYRVESEEIPPLQTSFTDIQNTVFKLYSNPDTQKLLRQVFNFYEEKREAVIPNSLLGGRPLIEWYAYVHYLPKRPHKKRVNRWLTEDGFSQLGYTIDPMFLSHVFGFDAIRFQRNRLASIRGEKLPYPELRYLLTSRLPMGHIIKPEDG